MSNDSTVVSPRRAHGAKTPETRPRNSGDRGGMAPQKTPKITANGAVTTRPEIVTPKVASQLARKRARDRRAQQAMRDRAKGEAETLKGQVAYLSQLLATKEQELNARTCQTATWAEDVRGLQQENERLRVELIQAKSLESRGSIASPNSIHCPRQTGIIIEPSILDLWSSHLSQPSTSPPAIVVFRKVQHQLQCDKFALSDRYDVPWHVAPSCPADRIMQPFCEEQRRQVESYGLSTPSPPLYRESHHADIQTAISKVAADVLATYSEIDTLPKKWYIFQTREVFEQMPNWLRPCSSQLEIPHPAWMDRVQWPRVRDYLIRHQDITFDEYTDAFSLSFDVNWPYDDSLVIVKEEDQESASVQWRISPVFEEHIRNIKHWTVGPRYWQLYPPMGKAVDEDRKQFGT